MTNWYLANIFHDQSIGVHKAKPYLWPKQHNMKHLLIILITFAISSMVNAQMLTLISESKQKTFPSLHELTVYAANNQSKKDYFTYNGQFVTATKDSITLRLKSMSHNLKDKNDKTIMHDHHYKNSPDLPEFMTIAKIDIYEIENYKSRKKAKGRKFRRTMGGLLLTGGLYLELES